MSAAAKKIANYIRNASCRYAAEDALLWAGDSSSITYAEYQELEAIYCDVHG